MESKKRKAIQTAKFFLFDTGVCHTLAQTQTLDRNSDLYGRAFEQWIGLEIKAYLSYKREKKPLTFWSSVQKQEVDFLIGAETAIEVKATRKVSETDFKGLLALKEEKVFKSFYLVSQDPIDHKRHGVHCLYWESFIKKLWKGDL